MQYSVGDWKGIPVPNGLAAFQLGGNINRGISTPICILRHHGWSTFFFWVFCRPPALSQEWLLLIQMLTRDYKLREMIHAIQNWHGNTYFTFKLCLNLSGSSSKEKVCLLWVVPHFSVCLSSIPMSARLCPVHIRNKPMWAFRLVSSDGGLSTSREFLCYHHHSSNFHLKSFVSLPTKYFYVSLELQVIINFVSSSKKLQKPARHFSLPCTASSALGREWF